MCSDIYMEFVKFLHYMPEVWGNGSVVLLPVPFLIVVI